MMLPTPDTSHVPYSRVYEPAEDSFLLLDTLSSSSEREFLRRRFGADSTTTTDSKNNKNNKSDNTNSDDVNDGNNSAGPTTTPLVVEIGTGSGVVIAFIAAHSEALFGTTAVMTAGVDVNRHACVATLATVAKATAEKADDGGNSSRRGRSGTYLDSSMSDLASCFRPGVVDVLVFNPPYVPTSEPPPRPADLDTSAAAAKTTFEEDSRLLAMAYAGGAEGMETTRRLLDGLEGVLSPRGCAYVLLCAQNGPAGVRDALVERLGGGWRGEVVGRSGRTAGWEKLQVLRIWNESVN